MEVVQGLEAMEGSTTIDRTLLAKIKDWFSRYLQWLTTHPYGKDEMNAANNHGTCWVMQVAAFAKFTNNDSLMDLCPCIPLKRMKNGLTGPFFILFSFLQV
jgi:hypothetical protein